MICKQLGTVLEFCAVLCYTVDEGKVIVWRGKLERLHRMGYITFNKAAQTKGAYLNPMMIV